MIESFDTQMEGVKILKTPIHWDDRGMFEETYREDESLGIPTHWAQDNISMSYQGVLRGMHIQKTDPQGKLVRCLRGVIWDAWVDLRPESKTFKKWSGIQLTGSAAESSPEYGEAIYLPPGIAHGFLCLSRFALVQYKCTTRYNRESDGGIYYDDPEVGIKWPFPSDFTPLLSGKDANLPSVAEYLEQLS